MGLLDEKEKLIRDNYVEVWKLIELLAGTNKYSHIGVYLGSIEAHTRKLPLYRVNEFYQVGHVAPPNNTYSDIEEIINCLIYDTNGTNEETQATLDKVCLKSVDYYWKKSDLLKFKELKDILVPTEKIESSSYKNEDFPETIPFEDFIKKAEDDLEQVSILYPTINYAEPHLRPLFLTDLFTRVEAACLISGDDPIKMNALIESGDLNYNSHYSEHSQAVKTIERAILAKNLELQHDLITRESLQKYFFSRGLTIQNFNTDMAMEFLSKSNNIGTPTIEHASLEHYQKHRDQLLKENEELKNTVINQDINIEKLKKLIEEIREKNSGLEYINHGLGNSIMWLESEKSDLEMKVKESETGKYIHPAFDIGNKNHAPELLLAIQAWESKYISNEYPHQDHTPAIKAILSKKGLTNVRLLDRIAAITNPNKK